MFTPPLPHVCFFHFSDTCSLGYNGSTKILESLLSLIPFLRADPALVLECYVTQNLIAGNLITVIAVNQTVTQGSKF
jgi:hypothetical protein